MKNALSRFLKDESGATAIEYALLACLIGVALIAVVTFTGTSISAKYKTAGDKLNLVK